MDLLAADHDKNGRAGRIEGARGRAFLEHFGQGQLIGIGADERLQARLQLLDAADTRHHARVGRRLRHGPHKVLVLRVHRRSKGQQAGQTGGKT